MDKTYQFRKEHRLCTNCAKPLMDDEKTRCKECAAIHNQKTKSYRDYYRNAGICIACGCEDAEPGKIFCFECAAKNRQKCLDWYENHKEEYKERKRELAKKQYAERKANGICIRCGKRKAYMGRSMCGICAENHRAYKRVKYG